jgi:hypothetical protein
VFLIAAVVVATAFVLTWFLEERPLRKTVETSDLGDAFAAPQSATSIGEITRELSRLVGRERTRRFIGTVTARAGVDVTPAEAWLIGRSEEGAIPAAAFEGRTAEGTELLASAGDRLRERGLVEPDGPRLTATGRDVCARLVSARQEELAALVADWDPESPEVDAMIARLARELARSEPSPHPA